MFNIINCLGNAKTTMQYNFTPVRTAIIKKEKIIISVGKDV